MFLHRGVFAINIQIDYQCPQCGAPALLEETDRIFTCQYCRVKSCLIPEGVFRYMLPHPANPGKDIFFLPYWRYRGMQYGCVGQEVQQRFVDVTQQAVDAPYFPMTLGVRAQAMKLSFVAPDTQGHFLAPDLPVRTVLQHQEDVFQSSFSGAKVYHHAHVGETLSLIYAPFYIDSCAVDAVLNRPVSDPLPEGVMDGLTASETFHWPLRFIPALCPSCGWDLSGERNALVLSCTNCNRAWQPVGAALKPVPVMFLPGHETADLYVPFWRIAADVTGLALSSYADLVRVANLPKVVQKGWDKIPCYFWSPAFRLSPKAFLSLSIQMNLTQPQENPAAGNPPGSCYPATLPVKEAAEALKISLAGMMKPAETRMPMLPQISIRPTRFALVYIPFQSGHQEWLQPEYHIAINKNLLTLTDH